MAKLMFYANGKPLTSIGVTQNDEGEYFFNGSRYFTPLLKDFNTAQPPAGFVKYNNGSHGPRYCCGDYYYQKALDFLVGQDVVITANTDCVVEYKSYDLGSFVKIKIDNKVVYLVHTYNWASGTVKAGQAICSIAPSSISHVAPHLHIYMDGGRIKDILLASNAKAGYKKGTLVEAVDSLFVRKMYSTSSDGVVVSKGQKMEIRTSPKYAEGYTWQYVHVKDNPAVTEGWVAIDFVKEYEGEPVNPCEEQNNEIKRLEGVVADLEKENGGLKHTVGSLQQENEKLSEENKQLMERVKDLEKQIKETERIVKECTEMNDAFERVGVAFGRFLKVVDTERKK